MVPRATSHPTNHKLCAKNEATHSLNHVHTFPNLICPLQTTAVDSYQRPKLTLTLKSPRAHACHESHKRSGALKTGIRCCERLSLLQSLLQSPLDFEAGRSIEGKESRSVEKAEGTREGGAMGRRKQGWKTNFSIMTEHFPCLVRFAPSSNDDPAYLQLHLTYRAFNRDHGRENSFAVEST